MANGLFIQVYCEIEAHPKFLRLCRLLGKAGDDEKLLIRAKLENLWMYAIRYYQDGVIPLCDEDISLFCGWKEESFLWIDSLQEAGFIARTECGVIIHDWEDYGGKLIKKREQSAKRQQDFREKHTSNANVTHIKREHTSYVRPEEKEIDKEEDKDKEKSLKEKKEGEESPAPPSCSDLAKTQDAEPPQPPKRTRKTKIIQDESPIVFSFPVIHPNGDPESWPLHQSLFDKFQDTYKGLDVMQEVKKARLWIDANNRKTYNGMAKFLTGWMDRAQNQLRGSPQPRQTTYEQRFADVESAKTLD